MQKKSAGSENIIGVGGSTKDEAAKIWGQLVVELLRNFKNRILGGWLSFSSSCSSSSSDSSRSGNESVPERKEKTKKTELSDSDREQFSLGDLSIKQCRRNTDRSADAPKRPQFAKPPMFHGAKDGPRPTGSGPRSHNTSSSIISTLGEGIRT